MSAAEKNNEPLLVEGDLLQLLSNVYAAGFRSGAATANATHVQAHGADLFNEQTQHMIQTAASLMRDLFRHQFEKDPTIRHDLISEWQLFANAIAKGEQAGGGCECQH